MSLLIAGIVMFGIGSLINAGTNEAKRTQERKNASAELGRKITLLKDEYDDAKEILNKDRTDAYTNYTNSMYRYGDKVSTVDMLMKSSAQSNATNIGFQNKQNYNAIDDLMRDNSRQIGSARQSVASSGFRNSGTASQLLDSVEQDMVKQKERAIAQAQMQTYQSILSATGMNINFNNQITDYKNAMEDMTTNWKLTDEKFTILENQAKDKFDQQLDYLQKSKANIDNYSSDARWNDIFGDIIKSGTELGKLFITNG